MVTGQTQLLACVIAEDATSQQGESEGAMTSPSTQSIPLVLGMACSLLLRTLQVWCESPAQKIWPGPTGDRVEDNHTSQQMQVSGPPTNLVHCPIWSFEPIRVLFLYLNLEPPFWISFCPQTAAPSNGPSYLPLLSLLSLPCILKLFSPNPPDPGDLHFLLSPDHQMPQTLKAFLTLN